MENPRPCNEEEERLAPQRLAAGLPGRAGEVWGTGPAAWGIG